MMHQLEVLFVVAGLVVLATHPQLGISTGQPRGDSCSVCLEDLVCLGGDSEEQKQQQKKNKKKHDGDNKKKKEGLHHKRSHVTTTTLNAASSSLSTATINATCEEVAVLVAAVVLVSLLVAALHHPVTRIAPGERRKGGSIGPLLYWNADMPFTKIALPYGLNSSSTGRRKTTHVLL